MRWLVAPVLLLLLGRPVAAQIDTGEIFGTVRDTEGGVLPRVSIVVQHLDSGTRGRWEGRYFLPSLRTGSYTITADLARFRRVIHPSSIQSGSSTSRNQHPAEFGGKASALINVVTPTGSNAFHANVFEFGRRLVFGGRGRVRAHR